MTNSLRIFASCHDDVAPYLQSEYIIRCVHGRRASFWKNPLRLPPKHKSIMASDMAPWGKGPLAFISGYSFGDAKMTLLGSHRFSIQRLASLPESQNRPRFQLQLPTGEKMGDNLLLYSNAGKEHEISCDKGEPGAPPGGQDLKLFTKSPKHNQVYLKIGNQKEIHLQRDALPIMSLNRLRDIKKGRGIEPLEYAVLDEEAMRAAGWYLPEGYVTKTFRGLACISVQDTRPTYRPKYDLEARPPGCSHLAVFVPPTEALSEATEALDHAFQGTSVYELPHIPNKSKIQNSVIGAVIGSSGSGKTSLGRELFHIFDVEWDNSKNCSCLQNLINAGSSNVKSESSPEALANELLQAVHLQESIYRRPFDTFSTGEQHRAEIARVLQKAILLSKQEKDRDNKHKAVAFEEFTSVLDRPTAKNVAMGVQGIAVKYGLSLVILSCHDDFIGPGLLTPDWVLQCPSRRFFEFKHNRKEQLKTLKKTISLEGTIDDEKALSPQKALRKGLSPKKNPATASNATLEKYIDKLGTQPTITLEVRRCSPHEWQLFREHHYKDHRLNAASACFIGLLQGKPVVFSGWTMEAINYIMRLKMQSVHDEKHADWGKIGLPESWTSRTLMREHRTVVLPEYQGLGLGKLMNDTLSHAIHSAGGMVTSVTVHPHYGGFRDRSPFWRALPTNRREKGHNKVAQYSHVWVGPMSATSNKNPALKPNAALQKQLEARIELKPPHGLMETPKHERLVGFQLETTFDPKHELLPDAIGVHLVGGFRGSKSNNNSPNKKSRSRGASPAYEVAGRNEFGLVAPKHIKKATYKKSLSRVDCSSKRPHEPHER